MNGRSFSGCGATESGPGGVQFAKARGWLLAGPGQWWDSDRQRHQLLMP